MSVESTMEVQKGRAYHVEVNGFVVDEFKAQRPCFLSAQVQGSDNIVELYEGPATCEDGFDRTDLPNGWRKVGGRISGEGWGSLSDSDGVYLVSYPQDICGPPIQVTVTSK